MSVVVHEAIVVHPNLEVVRQWAELASATDIGVADHETGHSHFPHIPVISPDHDLTVLELH